MTHMYRQIAPMASAAILILTLTLILILPGRVAWGQGVDPTGRPVGQIEIEGCEKVAQQLVRNQIRMQPGEPYDGDIVAQDIVRIEHLGKFSAVKARVRQQADGTLVLTYQVQEHALIADLQVVGNKNISDQKLMERIVLRRGDPIDPFLIDKAVNAIRDEYEQQGYFLTEINADQQLLAADNVLIFRVREGPKVQIKALRIEGNTAFSSKELLARVRSQAKRPLLFWRKTELNRNQLDLDTATIRNYYRDRGYLDAEVGRRIDLAPNQREAAVTFEVDEGRRYLVANIRVEGNVLFASEQIVAAIPLQIGQVFSRSAAAASRDAVLDLYGQLGFIETTVEIARLFHQTEPRVDLHIVIDEGQPYLVGAVQVRGNRVTKDKVILHDVRGMTPGRRFDRTQVQKTQQRLRERPQFGRADVTVLGEPDEQVRDVLIEVEEVNTGSVSIGLGVSSDLGLLGAITLTQKNFDIVDTPESFRELVTGQAFRGAGQFFSLELAPGIDNSRYSVAFSEPHIFDTNYSLNTRAFFYERDRDDWTEQRFGGSVGFGRRFGDVWSAATSLRGEVVDISDISTGAPTDIFAVSGDNLVTAVGLSIARNTTDSYLFPTEGSRLSMGIEQAGLVSDFDFTMLTLDFNKFWTVEEDFLGRKTVLSLRSNIGHIVAGNAPTFERLYAGGHRNFRGFEYRGVGPRGITPAGATTDEAVGGDWMFLLGLEYNIPVYKELIRTVFFVDTGTVDTDLSMSEYRVSVGTGLRFQLPIFGQGGPPVAVDFAVPIVKHEDDETQLISFDVAVPF